MLESLAANLLNRLLGAYVENFDPAQLNVGIWSGDVVLKKLKLRNDCLDALNLPINVRYGILGNLVLTVPWSSLKNKPVKITIEDCYMLCAPQDPNTFDDKERLERELRLKLRKLAEWELANAARANKNNKDSPDEGNESFMQSLLTKVVDNLQITIRNIHIRYEDTACILSKEPCSLGITLSELSAVSSDSNWVPSFISMSNDITNKLITLNSLCFYWNTNGSIIENFDSSTDSNQVQNKFKESITSTETTVSDYSYVLKPITGTGRLSVNKLGSTDIQPHIDLQMMYDEFCVELGDAEYAAMLHILSAININNKVAKFKKNRPKLSVSEDPKQWFIYTASSIYNEVKQKNEIWTWEHIKNRCNERRSYIDLWLQKLQLSNIENKLSDPNNQTRLDDLERIFDYEDIILFRSIAKKMHERLKKDTSKEISTSPVRIQAESKAWYSSLWTDSRTSQGESEIELTEEQRKELYDAIEFTEDDTTVNNIQIPKDRVTLRISSFLNKGSFFIKKSKGMDLGEMIFERCYFEFLQRPDSHMTSFKLQRFRVEDCSPNTLYKHIINVKDLKSFEDNEELISENPLFEASFEQNPLDGSSDSKVDVKLRGMTIFYHVHFVNDILKFFTPQNQNMETIGAILTAAEATVEGWTSQTRMGLEALLEEHKTIDINLDLQAPLIIIPLDPHSWETPCAVIDAGHITLVSDLMSKDKIKCINDMSIEEYEKIDGSEINRLMFDRFQFCSQDTQILIGSTVRSTISSLSEASEENIYSILDKMCLELTIDISILPKAYNLPRCRTFGRLPQLSISINDQQYKIIMLLINKCIPSVIHLDDNEEVLGLLTSESQEKKNIQVRLSETVKILRNMSEAEIFQRFLDVDFDVESIKISIFQCKDTATMNGRKLIDLLGNGLKFNFVKKAKEMNMDINMHALNVIDFIEPNNDRTSQRRIISSEDVSLDKKSNLFSLKYLRQQRIVSHENTLIEVFDQDVDINMAQLHLGIATKSILTLLNYAFTTFLDPTATDMPTDALRHNSEDAEEAPQKINMMIKMAGLVIDFDDNCVKLATWRLSSGEYSMVILPEKMKLDIKLGNMELIAATIADLIDNPYMKIFTLEDEGSVEFSYETFDSADNKHDYDSILRYNATSIQINFIEEPINEIINYFYKFQRMKVLFEKARQVAYNQTPSINTVNNMKLDINIKSPLIKFPKESLYEKGKYDFIDFYLGDVVIQNEFSQLPSFHKVNQLQLCIQECKLSSLFNLENNIIQKFNIIKNMKLVFNIDHDPTPSKETPTFKVKSVFDLSPASITECQLRYMLSILESIFSSIRIKDVNSEELDEEVVYVNNIVESFSNDNLSSSDLRTSLSPTIKESLEEESKFIDFLFEAPEISLTLFNNTAQCTNLQNFGLTKFKFEKIALNFVMNNNGTLEGDSHVGSFTIEDIRNIKDNKHTELVPKIKGGEHQFTASLSRKIFEEGLLTTLSVTIDNPLVILAMDYLFELKSFYDNSFELPAKITPERPIQTVNGIGDISHQVEDHKNKFQYIFNMINPQVLLLADPSDIESEAVIFKVGQFQASSENISTFIINNVGVFLSKMQCPATSDVRLLDDFSSSIVIDQRDSTAKALLTEVRASIQPLLMRISLRDIRLAMLIFNRAVWLMNKAAKNLEDTLESSDNLLSNSDDSKSKALNIGFGRQLKQTPIEDVVTESESTMVILGERLNIEFGGLRLVLIGDVHEMPILDMNVSSFEIVAKNWSTELDALASLETYVNVFNYSRSSWEPLIEPVPISFHLAKGIDKDAALIFDIITRKVAEMTLSSRSISMLSQIPNSLSGDLTLKPRGLEKPYMLFNDTELDLDVWIVTDNVDERKNLVTLPSNEHLPWEFEDWRTVREKLDIDNKCNKLGISISGSKYTTVMKINATYEGEQMFVLKPAISQIHNRLICELKSGEDNVKNITFRSTLTLENTTDTKIQFILENNNETLIYDIEPEMTKSVPLEHVYSSQIRIKPCSDDFGWSQQLIYWKDLLTNPISVQCVSHTSNEERFYFEVNAKYDKREPLAKIFPRMKVIISSPIVIENLLPCPLKFSLFDKRNGGNVFKLLEKGGKLPVHDVSLDNFLLLSIQPLMDEATPSKPSIINTPVKSALTPENSLLLTLSGNQKLNLKISYQRVEGTRAKIIKIYSSYIILNASGRDIYIQDSTRNITQSKQLIDDGIDSYTTLKMFSFSNNDYKNNRANIRFKESDWSIPLSFDAIGQSYDVITNIPNKEQASNLGVNISEGEGIYSMSKMVSISPRYIVQNDLDMPIELCEFGSSIILGLESKNAMPMFKMRTIINKQLQLRFLSAKSDWSAPFYIKDIGFTYLKVLNEDSTHILLKIEIILDKATIFIRIKDGENLWPYSIRNFSDYEFIFYQRDPKIIDDYYETEGLEESNVIGYKPLYYRVPPKSIMPYTWDYPSARQKKIVLTSRGRKREIQLAEIGNLTPMRLPGALPTDPVDTVELDVVADGPIQALTITNYRKELSMYKLKTRQSASSLSVDSSKEVFEAKEKEEHIFRKLVVKFKGFGMSFINTDLQELFYVSIREIELKYNDSDLYQTFSWKIKWLQIDNQLFSSTYPNILYPTKIPEFTKEIENYPVLSGSISKVKDDTHGVMYFKHLTVLLQELSIQLDEDFLFSLLEFATFPGAAWNKDIQGIVYDEKVGLPTFTEVQFSKDIYFEVFHIQPMMLHISFARSELLHTSEGKERVSNYQNTLQFLANILTMTIGNVNNAPIRMNSLFMDNLRVPVATLINSIKTHYGQQFIYQLYKILGSADFLGNPVGLFNTISSGVWDIFYEPYKGYLMNDRPEEIGINIAKGGLSFAKKTVFGISDSMAKFTGSVAKGLSVTQDSEFQESRRLQQRINTTSRNVLATSAQSFANTIGSSISGLALDPLKGAQKEGTAGFMKGLGKGIFGLPTKTAIGILDLTSNLSQGVKSTTTILDNSTQSTVRLTRYVGHDQIIKPYNLRESQGQYWLKTCNGGLYMNSYYLTHVVLPGRELAVIISMEHIVEVSIADEEVMWSTAYQFIQGIVLEKGGIHIKLKSQAEYFIPIADPTERKYVYRNIAIAVTEYNKYCETAL